MNIAIVDDEPGILLAMRLYLEMEGHHPLLFSSPLEALKTLQTEKADMVIIDMRMPEMDGEELARRLKGNEKTKEIPLILFSAHETVSEVAARVGAYGILEKPFDFEELAKIIQSVEENKYSA
ncbi:MAG: response regulator [Clostridia bacterium]|jgi:DNA-binding NtrC family response regulator|nr:response regulator [Clostridia bacterium]